MFAHTGPCDLLPNAWQTMHGMSGEPVRESAGGGNIQERTQSVQNGIPSRCVRNDNQLPCLTFRVTGLSVPHLDGAQSIALTTHLDLHRDSFVHFLDVGNHADLATLRLQAVEGVHRQLQ